MCVCVLTHCKITHPIVMLYQRRKPKSEEKKRPLHLVPYIHNNIVPINTYIIYLFIITQHTHTHRHTHKANDIKLIFVCSFVYFFLSRAIQTRPLYIYHHFFHHLLVKYTKQSICFSPSTLCYINFIHIHHYYIYCISSSSNV